MGKLILILGGARSGKSALAETLARRLGRDAVLYVATAEAGDAEMAERIARHRTQRPPTWRTLEQSLDIAPAILEQAGAASVILLDCMTLLASNVVLAAGDDGDAAETRLQQEVDALLAAIHQLDATVIVVSNEVGLGLVPPYPLGRVYRDALGRANQRLARAADHVYFLVAGLPMTIKGSPPETLMP